MHTTESNGCCHDEVKIIKIQDNYNASAFSFSTEKFFQSIIELSSFIAIDFNESLNADRFSLHTPPLLSEQEIYLQNSVFLI